MSQLLKGVKDSNTITVGELIQCLQNFPPGMSVAFTWEGQVLPVLPERFEIMPDTDRVCGPVLLLDAET